MVEENFEYCRPKSFQIGSILPPSDNYFTSPWLKKILKIDIINGSRLTQFDISWEDRKDLIPPQDYIVKLDTPPKFS